MDNASFHEYVNTSLNCLTKSTFTKQVDAFKQAFVTYGREIKNVLAKHLACKRVIGETNQLDLYAKMVARIKDEEFDEILVKELTAMCYELLDKKEATVNVKEALRNIGTFFGLVTIARDKAISADLIDFLPLLEDTIKSGNEVKLKLAVVLVTHIFKYCQRSEIFKKECTWVSRIIDVIKQIQDAPNMKTDVIFEIERFFDYLDNANREQQEKNAFNDFGTIQYNYENNEQSQSIVQQMVKQMSLQVRQQLPPFAFKPAPPFVPQHMRQPIMDMRQGLTANTPNHYYTAHTTPQRMTQQEMTPPRTPKELQDRHLAQQQLMFSQAPTPLSDFQQQHTPQRQFISTTPSRVVHQSFQRPPPEFNRSAKSPYNSDDDLILKAMVSKLDFSDAPIFSIFKVARQRVVDIFPIIMHEVQKEFLERVKPLLAVTCEAFVLRDMAFCTDEAQFRFAYEQAIRIYVMAFLQPRCNAVSIRLHLHQLFKCLFTRIVQESASMLPDHSAHNKDHFILHSVGVFLEKNDGIVTDFVRMLLDNHVKEWADQVATRCLKERTTLMLGHKNLEFKHFVDEPRNMHDINVSLPMKLHRSYGHLDDIEFGVYKQHEELSEELHQYMEKYGFQDVKGQEGTTEDQEESSLEDNVTNSEYAESEELEPEDNLLHFIENLYKMNPSENPDFFIKYTRSIMQQNFLDRLKAEFAPKEACGYLVVLMLPVVRLISRFADQGILKDISENFASSVVHVFTVLTQDFPEAFDTYYMAFSEAMPDVVMLHLRNLVMNCKPESIELPLFTDFQQICASVQMNTGLDIDVEQFCKMPSRLKNIISSRMVNEQQAGFPSEIVVEFKHTEDGKESVYDRPLMLHSIVYIAHLSIKKIHSRNWTINRSNLASNSGQNMLFELVDSLDDQGWYIAFALMVDQLRYPSSMTAYFICLLLNLFTITNNAKIRETLCRVLIERFLPQSPYPWSLRLIMWEMMHNPSLQFNSYDYLQGSDEIKTLIKRIESICQSP